MKKEDKNRMQEVLCRQARYALGKDCQDLTASDLFRCTALAVRDRMVEGMLATETRYRQADAKRLYYLSMEFLIGRSLGNNLVNLGLLEACRETLLKMGYDLEEVHESEADAALGNGGLGRLAACFLDSLATLGLAGYGYGIHYEYGLFRQEIDDGYQKEKPDNWLAQGTPWEIERPDEACLIPVYGRIEPSVDRRGEYNPLWLDWKLLVGVPHDIPIAGYGGHTVNVLRLYAARSSQDFDMQIFNAGDYLRAVEQKIASETVSKVLYPSDTIEAGRELRLLQEYFLVACAVRDIVRRYLRDHDGLGAFPAKVAIQLNDTHPALTVAELMRVLVDEHELPWETAWEMTQATLGYTNHTLMPEALERWPLNLLERVVPRHLQIIREINRRFLAEAVNLWPDDPERCARVSIIEEGREPHARMAHLAIVGSHSINGVSKLHSELIKTRLVPEFYQLWPERFSNKTNGVTQRRWLLMANPGLANLLCESIGPGWITELEELHRLESLTDDSAFRARFAAIKRVNKERLATVSRRIADVDLDPASMFDVQAKRIHEYKRQLLMALGIVHQYLILVEDGIEPPAPRSYILAGKAAPGYWAARMLIKLINNLGAVINNDPRTRGLIKVAFLPDYRVSLAEKIMPAADLSEQISTAGREASGTGNMKFAMNGALTIGTLDGANIEIREAVGADNIFIFGMTADRIAELTAKQAYHPIEYYESDP
ncbi:MAG TPA: glycogen/starch/alpha-glucan phosphorylase, partial [Chthonomonadaceae bacterium]|nr:glycogen/starch/alpha-glucan phosphorylase [Chthonomonadaceae bacterium]